MLTEPCSTLFRFRTKPRAFFLDGVRLKPPLAFPPAQYTWLRSLMNRYADFWQVTRDALVYACRSLELACGEDQQADLLQEYLRLGMYADVAPGLRTLAPAPGDPLQRLSRMLQAVVEHAGLTAAFSALLSVDEVKTYKPSPAVYELALRALASRGARSALFLPITGMPPAPPPSVSQPSGSIVPCRP